MSGDADMDQRRGSEQGLLKSRTENEFLVKIGAKEEEFEWEPKIVNERLRRSSSFVCAQYDKPACFRAKPKTVAVNPWKVNSQALRQLNMITRFGPRRYYINNQDIHQIGDVHLRGPTTQALGLCYPPKTVAAL
ncbi:uncharacterized protein LOC127869079 isoform X2 [Dreissena polymorpha]|uniref:uncharacterized protein LOC127869079 isoform X2 n=1 Tax=Dreissena polymorpha TaxID=45954 RepID=UPI0022647D64|nr:uncharacterized protein LOC127869079 isoform X2 [Dreissena polymorpha]